MNYIIYFRGGNKLIISEESLKEFLAVKNLRTFNTFSSEDNISLVLNGDSIDYIALEKFEKDIENDSAINISKVK